MNISRDATIILTRDVSLRYGKFLKSIVFAHSTIYADSYIVVNICNNLYILGLATGVLPCQLTILTSLEERCYQQE